MLVGSYSCTCTVNPTSQGYLRDANHNHARRMHWHSIYRKHACKVYKLRKQGDLLLGPPPLPERGRKLSRVYLS